MKKNRYISFAIALLLMMGTLLMPAKVHAAQPEEDIKSVTATGTTTEVQVFGTTGDNVVAVLAEVFDEDNNLVTMETHPAAEGKFTAKVGADLEAGETYTVYVVNFNGEGTGATTTFMVPIPVTGVSLNKTEATLSDVGESVQLSATVAPANATNQKVSWKSSDTAVATVDANGKVTAVGAGKTTITVTTEDGKKTATATITVEMETPAKPETKVQINTGIKEIPQSLKDAGLDTEKKIKDKMLVTVLGQAGYTAERSILYDVELMISLDGGNTWIKATKENFPQEGITVTIPYPAGTTKDNYDFLITHMFTVEMNGHQPGEVEMPKVTKTDSGIQFTVKSLSPIMVSWKEVATKAPAETPTVAAPTASVQTGDPNNIMMWIVILAVGIMICGAVVLRRKTR